MTNPFIKAIDVRWADLDPNYHVRHSVYYDYGAYCRICFFNENGITSPFLAEHQIGPILFREECIFRKELRLGDAVTIDLQLLKAKSDYSRWSIQHIIRRNNDLAATLTLDGAWIDTIKRKLTNPPGLAHETFDKMPRMEKFEWLK
jgi:acyl-CoA thioester hydrolase